MGRSLGFASTSYDLSLVKTRFRFGCSAEQINLAVKSDSPVHYAKGTQSPIPPKGHRAPTACRLMVSGSLTPLEEVLFIVQSPYWFAIGRQGVLSLGGWAPLLRTEFHELHTTLDTISTESAGFYLQDFHLMLCDFPDTSTNLTFVTPQWSSTPGLLLVWAMSAFARRY
jgi:hypothetical protein